jgi:hypothetical protein
MAFASNIIPSSESTGRASYATFAESGACISPDRPRFPDLHEPALQNKLS